RRIVILHWNCGVRIEQSCARYAGRNQHRDPEKHKQQCLHSRNERMRRTNEKHCRPPPCPSGWNPDRTQVVRSKSSERERFPWSIELPGVQSLALCSRNRGLSVTPVTESWVFGRRGTVTTLDSP